MPQIYNNCSLIIINYKLILQINKLKLIINDINTLLFVSIFICVINE